MATTTSLPLQATDSKVQQPGSMVETYDDWTVQCQTATPKDVKDVKDEKQEAATRTCQVSQELKQSSTGNRVLLLVITSVKNDVADVTIVGPFGLLLSEGIVFFVDEKELSSAEFKTCMPIGCVSTFSLNKAELNSVRQGETMGVHTVAANGQKLLTNMSLKGIKAAVARLAELDP